MTDETITAAPAGLADLKQAHRGIWASGDYAAVAERMIDDVPPRHLMERVAIEPGMEVLDIAAGTGNAALRAAQLGARVTALDLTPELFERGRERAAAAGVEIDWVEGDAEDLPFEANSFDAYTIAFGIRNVPRVQKALDEAHRVLKRGGRILVLEFSQVDVPGFGALYRAYSDTVIPPMGKLVTGDAQPYQYFIESIRKFPKPAEFDGMLAQAGFKRVKHTSMTGNIATLFSGWKI